MTWLFALLSLYGAVLNIRKKTLCFVVWSVANIGWVWYNVAGKDYSQAFVFAVFLLLNFYGWNSWRKGR